MTLASLFQHDLAFRQRIQKPLAVEFRPYSGVKNGDYACIVFGPNQPPEGLFQPNDSLGEIVFHKGVTTCSLNILYPSFHDGMRRH